MRRRLITVILFAVLAAFVSSTLMYKIISGNSQRNKGATASVLVAARDLDAGTLVGDADVRPVDWPVVDGSHWIGKRTDVVGRALLTPVAKDEPFADSRLAAKGAGAGLASRIPPGMRVVAVHVDELTGLSRFILPGMHVDVISTGSEGAQNGRGMVARTILQNIEVFSSGQNTDQTSNVKEKPLAAGVFNLLVTPRQAEALSLAVAQTRIELVLRNPLDKGSFVAEVVPAPKLPPLIPAPKPRKVAVKAAEPDPKPVVGEKKPVDPPPMPTVEVIHGTKRTVSAVAVATDPETQQ